MNDLLALHAKRTSALPSERSEVREEGARVAAARAVEEVRAVDQERDRRRSGARAATRSTTARHSSSVIEYPVGLCAGSLRKTSARRCVGELAAERGVEGGDIEAAAGAEHREGLELALGLVAERVVRAPVPARGQQRLAGLEEVGDREAQRAGPARGRDRDGARLERRARRRAGRR